MKKVVSLALLTLAAALLGGLIFLTVGKLNEKNPAPEYVDQVVTGTAEGSQDLSGTGGTAGGAATVKQLTDVPVQTGQTAAAQAGANPSAVQAMVVPGVDGSTGVPQDTAGLQPVTDSTTVVNLAASEETDTSMVQETSPADSGVVYVTTTINVRSEPNTDCTVLGQLNSGAKVQKTGESGEWTQIDYDGSTAYVKTEYVTTEKPSLKSDWDLGDLSTESVNFGYSSANRDPETNVPTDWEYYDSLWGEYAVKWIGDTSKNTIYLTMDEGFPNENTVQILQTLKDRGVHITFFLTKYFADGKPDLVQQMIDEGHQLGNHTCTHPDMTSLSVEEQTDQIMTLHDQIKDSFGYDMHFFRFPQGIFSDETLGLVNNLGYETVFWSYAYNDYDTENQPPVDESLEKALDALHPGAIYLLHADSDTNTAFLGDFIDGARERGYEFGELAFLE